MEMEKQWNCASDDLSSSPLHSPVEALVLPSSPLCPQDMRSRAGLCSAVGNGHLRALLVPSWLLSRLATHAMLEASVRQ